MRRVLNGLFAVLIAMNLRAGVHEQQLGARSPRINKLMSVTPLLFLSATTFYENRFEFYDLLVKRGAMLLADAVLLLGGVLRAGAAAGSTGCRARPSRPWLFALTVVPLMLAAPWLAGELGRALDRAWFGRHYSPVSAVTSVLASLQTATDEPSLIAAAESSLQATCSASPCGSRTDGARRTRRASPSRSRARVADPSLWVSVPAVPGERRAAQRRPDAAAIARLGRHVSARERAPAAAPPGAGPAGPGTARAVEPVGAEGAARADQPALPVQRAQHRGLAHPLAIRRAPTAPSSSCRRCSATPCGAPRASGRHSIRSWRSPPPISTSRRRASDPPALHHRRRRPTPGGPWCRRCWCTRWSRTPSSTASRRCAGTGALDVVARVAADRLVVEVIDNGPGPGAHTDTRRPSRRRVGEQFGLRSVRDRLRGHFGDAATFTLTRDEAQRPHGGPHRDADRVARRPPRPGRPRGARRDPRPGRRRRSAGARPAARAARRDRRRHRGRRGRRRRRRAARPSRDTTPDVVFLDIEMPAERGTDLAATLPEPRPFIVFATAYERFAVDAFQYDAADYLLKPVNRQRLQADARAAAREARRPPRRRARGRRRRRARRRFLLPQSLPEAAGYTLAARTLAAAAVGGDFYDAVVGRRSPRVRARRRRGQGHGRRPHRVERAGPVAGGAAAARPDTGRDDGGAEPRRAFAPPRARVTPRSCTACSRRPPATCATSTPATRRRWSSARMARGVSRSRPRPRRWACSTARRSRPPTSSWRRAILWS